MSNLLEPIEIEKEKYTEEEYDEILDEQGKIYIGSISFYPSYILSKLDPIAYNCGFSDIQEYKTVYQCPICEEEHEEEEEAKFCCQEEE